VVGLSHYQKANTRYGRKLLHRINRYLDTRLGKIKPKPSQEKISLYIENREYLAKSRTLSKPKISDRNPHWKARGAGRRKEELRDSFPQSPLILLCLALITPKLIEILERKSPVQ